jgi:[histone H3]-lysine9 N-dimethyltransferase
MNQPSNFMPTPDQDVLDVKPLRTLAPMLPAPLGVNTFNQSTTPPLVLVTPAGQYQGDFGAWDNSAARSFFAFSTQDACGGKADIFSDQNTGGGKEPAFSDQDAVGKLNAATRDHDAIGPQNAAPSWTSDVIANANSPIDATPISAYESTQPNVISLDEDEEEEEPCTPNQTSASGRKIKRPSCLSRYNISDGLESDSFNVVSKRSKSSHKKPIADDEIACLAPSGDPREIVEVVLMTFEALQRRHLQLDKTQETSRRADLKAGAIMMARNLRANTGKRIGVVPGVKVGDIFYVRMELCIIGLHAPSMGGIDYMTTTFGDEDDSVAICIVAAGAYDNNDGCRC